MDAFLILVPRIQPGELPALHDYLRQQLPGYSRRKCVYVLDERVDIPPQVSPPDPHNNLEMVAGYGRISDLIADIAAGTISSGKMIWIPSISLLLDSIPDYQALVHELHEGYDVAIGVRDSIPFLQKTLGKVLFPDLRDSYSDRFLIQSESMREMDMKHVYGPALPHILAQLKPGAIAEFSWRGQGVYSASNNRHILPQFVGIVQILKRMTRCRQSLVGKEMHTLTKFVIVGFSGIIVNTGLLFLLTEYAHVYYLLSSAFAIETSILTNFILNERWTFVNRACSIQSRWKRLFSYNILAIGGMVVNVGILFLLTEYAGMYYLLANIFGIFTAFTWNYLSNRHITWK